MWLFYALLNPFAESVRNLFSKKASLNGVDPILISWCNNIIPSLILIPIFFFIDIKINYTFIWAISLTGSINIVAVILYMKAISKGDISQVVPMLSFTPLFLLISSPLIIGEFPDLKGLIGVALIVFGSYILNVRLKSKDGFLSPLKSLIKNKGSRYMLIVAVLWSVSSVVDKVSIKSSSVYQHIIFFNFIIFSGVSLVALFSGKINLKTVYDERKNLAALSAATAVAYIVHATALTMTYVAYVIALKRMSGVISVFFGSLFLKEAGFRERAIGAVIMFLGVVFIVFS